MCRQAPRHAASASTTAPFATNHPRQELAEGGVSFDRLSAASILLPGAALLSVYRCGCAERNAIHRQLDLPAGDFTAQVSGQAGTIPSKIRPSRGCIRIHCGQQYARYDSELPSSLMWMGSDDTILVRQSERDSIFAIRFTCRKLADKEHR